MEQSKNRVRIALGVLQIVIGIGAIPAGVSLVLDPTGAGLGMSLDWLVGSPFSDFAIPGLVLLLVNGQGSLIGALLTFIRHRTAPLVAMGLGLFLIGWIMVQLIMPNLTFHWLQPTYLVFGAAEMALGWLLDPDAVRRVFSKG